MTTTYYVGISLADSLYRSPTNPHRWVPGFDTDPANWLQANAQPFADAGIPILFHNAFGRGGTDKSFRKRFDGKPTVPTQAEWMPNERHNQFFALSEFVRSPGVNAMLYVGAPEIGRKATLMTSAERLSEYAFRFPNTPIIYDNVGDADTSEHTPASALFAAHDTLARRPFMSPVRWGIEPNPASHNTFSPLHHYSPDYIYGTPATWGAETRWRLDDTQGYTPIVAIRGDEFTTAEERIAVAREWGPKVAPYNGIVVVHGVTVEQMEQINEAK